MNERLRKQCEFIIEIDKIKNIFRQTRIYDNSRYENDAEHAWHMSMMALILAEHANTEIDIARVIKMALIHDIVEIDAGDIFLYTPNQEDKHEKEQKAAQRIFGLLPDDQRDEYITLWEEFEAKETPEAKFAGAVDRLGPIMQNHRNTGHAWRKHGIPAEKVRLVNAQIAGGSETLWEFAQELIVQAIRNGDLRE
jgi:putative hydrolases of HD superfamily